MQLFGLNKRRSQTLLLAIGQLVLIAYVFQVAAFDHWHADSLNDITGVDGTSAHAALHADHCHGGPSSCAESGGGFAQLSAGHVIRLPSADPSLILEADPASPTPIEASIGSTPEPPRA